MKKIVLPFRDPEKYPLTQRFGVKFLYHGKICEHKGVDYGLPASTPLCCPFEHGKITRITPDRTTGYGKAVYIRSLDDKSDKIEALVAHMSHINVKVGLKLKRYQNLGMSGRSGFWRGRNGYHVHFGLSVNGSFIDPLHLLKVKEKQEENLFNQDDDTVKSFLGSYVVKKGDSLWKIAEKYYGVGGHFMEIYIANEDIISDPNLIHPGDTLRIPALKNKGV